MFFTAFGKPDLVGKYREIPFAWLLRPTSKLTFLSQKLISTILPKKGSVGVARWIPLTPSVFSRVLRARHLMDHRDVWGNPVFKVKEMKKTQKQKEPEEAVVSRAKSSYLATPFFKDCIALFSRISWMWHGSAHSRYDSVWPFPSFVGKKHCHVERIFHVQCGVSAILSSASDFKGKASAPNCSKVATDFGRTKLMRCSIDSIKDFKHIIKLPTSASGTWSIFHYHLLKVLHWLSLTILC